MIVTDFATCLSHYFNDYLINDRSSASKTIETYRYAFIQLIEYLETEKAIKPEKIHIRDFNRNNIINMLNWLEDKRKISMSTRNQRLAAFKSFAGFLRYEKPEFIAEITRIQNIRQKKGPEKNISYLKPEGIKLILSQINQRSPSGRRDYTMISLLFTTGIRVTELINIRGCDVSLSSPKSIVIYGKGAKIRHVPIVKHIAPLLTNYLDENKCLLPQRIDDYIFRSHTGGKFTRQGISYIISKYAKIARGKEPALIPKDCSPHKIRHSSAMALLEQGVNLVIIRDLLGHSSIQITEIYAKVSSAESRSAIEAASKEIVPQENALWESNHNIKDWLKGLTQNKIVM